MATVVLILELPSLISTEFIATLSILYKYKHKKNKSYNLTKEGKINRVNVGNLKHV